MTVDFQASLFDEPATELRHRALGALGGLGADRHRARARAPGSTCAPAGCAAPTTCSRGWSATCRGTPSGGRCTTGSSTYRGCSGSTAADEPSPDPLLADARDALSAHYAAELGEPFTTAGMCYYRDGRDSVAWHGDTIGRPQHRGHDGRDRVARRRPAAVAAAARRRSRSRRLRRWATATCS